MCIDKATEKHNERCELFDNFFEYLRRLPDYQYRKLRIEEHAKNYLETIK